MNSLIDLLVSERNMTVKRLKQIYRELSKKTHPDVTQKKGDEFIRLKTEYEEALKILKDPAELSRLSGHLADQTAPRQVPASPREAVLRDLATFVYRIFSDDAAQALERMIGTSEAYKPILKEILTAYRDAFYVDFPKWRHIGRIFYTHGIFITAARQLFTYYASGKDRHKSICEGCLRDLDIKAKSLDNARCRILLDLSAWLRVELKKERIEVEYV